MPINPYELGLTPHELEKSSKNPWGAPVQNSFSTCGKSIVLKREANILEEKLKRAPKKSNQGKNVDTKEDKKTSKREEATVRQCNYCQYRHADPDKPVQRLYPVSNFSDKFKDYVINFSTVSEFPEKQGLLKDGDQVCNACRLVLQSKFDAFFRGSDPFTPKKRGRKSLTELEPQASTSMTSEQGTYETQTIQTPSEKEIIHHEEKKSPKAKRADADVAPSARKRLKTEEIASEETHEQTIAPTASCSTNIQSDTTMETDVTGTLSSESVSSETDAPKSSKKCVICKEPCIKGSLKRKQREFRSCGLTLLKDLENAGYSLSGKDNLVHEPCRDTFRIEIINTDNMKEHVIPTEVKVSKDEAINLSMQFTRKQLLETKNPVLFQHIVQNFHQNFKEIYDPDYEESATSDLLRWHVQQLEKECEEIKCYKAPGNRFVMYYHENTDFKQWSYEQLQEIDMTSPHSSSSQTYSKMFVKGPSDVLAIHNCLKLLRNELASGSKVCKMYGQYPELIASVTQNDLLFDGKKVRVSDPEEEELPAQKHDVTIPPFPALLINFIMILCARPGSVLEKTWENGEIDYTKAFKHNSLNVEFYTSILNLAATILHKFNHLNTYPWPIMVAQVMNHPSRAKKVEMCKQLGLIPSESTYKRYKAWVAIKYQKQTKEGNPFGYVDGHHISFHLDNKEFMTKHSIKKPIQQYLAACGIQSQPSNSELKLPASAYSSLPTDAPTEIENFDIVDFTAMFPSNAPNSSRDMEGNTILQVQVDQGHNPACSPDDSIPEELHQQKEGTSGSQMQIHESSIARPTEAVEPGVVQLTQQTKRSVGELTLMHTNIPEYTIPTSAVSLRYEYEHQRSDFLLESISDQKKYDQYESTAFTHASLRSRS